MRKWVYVLVGGVVLVGVGVALLVPAPVALPLADPSTRVETADGTVVGFVEADTGSRVWLGIPYAAAPVGELRWRAPRPAPAWDAPIEAVTPGSACVQHNNSQADFDDPDEDGVIGSEDCLYLNVYAPAGAESGSPLPVMFWIHGGGNSVGHAGPYHGGTLAQIGDVVVVALNYRLGPFGWFSHPALRDEELATGDDPRWFGADASGNYGTLDLLQGLAWVRDNIAAFGGDPGNVTVFGESAGGTNTLALLVSPLAAGMFHRAIVQSGGIQVTPRGIAEGWSDGGRGHERSSREVMAALLQRRGESAGQARERVDSMDTRAARSLLYDTPAAELMALYEPQAMGMVAAPALFADGLVLPSANVPDLLRRRNYNAVPVIVGANRDEAKLFMAMSPEWVETRFGFLPRLKDPDAYDRAARYRSELWRHRGVDSLARTLHAAQGSNVFAYRFDWDEEGSILGFDLARALGAAHGLELAFVFGRFEDTAAAIGDIYDEARVPERDALSQTMMSYWAQFAHRGDPGRGRTGEEVDWLPWSNVDGGPRILVFDTPTDGGVRMSREELTLAGMKSRLLADESFTHQRERCDTYARLFRGGSAWDDAEYATLGDGGCTNLPP